jgi:hypothetical protein
MREPATQASVLALLRALSQRADRPTTVCLVGGTRAVIEGWRESTMDIDLVLRPESDAMRRAIPC